MAQNKCPSKACICSALTVWIFVSVCALIVSSFIYLKPFFKVIRYQETTCQVESTFFTTQYVCPCDGHGHQCPSYPCFLVHVSLNFTDGQLWVVNLYVDDDQQAAVLDASDDRQEKCTLRACVADNTSDKHLNRETVEEFKRRYGEAGLMVPCYFDPLDIRSGAVLKATIPGWEVFHSVFWPAISLALGLTICGVFCHWCRKKVAINVEAENSNSLNQNATSSVQEDANNYAAAARVLLAKKKRTQRSLRNFWMLQQNV